MFSRPTTERHPYHIVIGIKNNALTFYLTNITDRTNRYEVGTPATTTTFDHHYHLKIKILEEQDTIILKHLFRNHGYVNTGEKNANMLAIVNPKKLIELIGEMKKNIKIEVAENEKISLFLKNLDLMHSSAILKNTGFNLTHKEAFSLYIDGIFEKNHNSTDLSCQKRGWLHKMISDQVKVITNTRRTLSLEQQKLAKQQKLLCSFQNENNANILNALEISPDACNARNKSVKKNENNIIFSLSNKDILKSIDIEKDSEPTTERHPYHIVIGIKNNALTFYLTNITARTNRYEVGTPATTTTFDHHYHLKIKILEEQDTINLKHLFRNHGYVNTGEKNANMLAIVNPKKLIELIGEMKKNIKIEVAENEKISLFLKNLDLMHSSAILKNTGFNLTHKEAFSLYIDGIFEKNHNSTDLSCQKRGWLHKMISDQVKVITNTRRILSLEQQKLAKQQKLLCSFQNENNANILNALEISPDACNARNKSVKKNENNLIFFLSNKDILKSIDIEKDSDDTIKQQLTKYISCIESNHRIHNPNVVVWEGIFSKPKLLEHCFMKKYDSNYELQGFADLDYQTLLFIIENDIKKLKNCIKILEKYKKLDSLLEFSKNTELHRPYDKNFLKFNPNEENIKQVIAYLKKLKLDNPNLAEKIYSVFIFAALNNDDQTVFEELYQQKGAFLKTPHILETELFKKLQHDNGILENYISNPRIFKKDKQHVWSRLLDKNKVLSAMMDVVKPSTTDDKECLIM